MQIEWLECKSACVFLQKDDFRTNFNFQWLTYNCMYTYTQTEIIMQDIYIGSIHNMQFLGLHYPNIEPEVFRIIVLKACD
jgi:hypothetical protein